MRMIKVLYRYIAEIINDGLYKPENRQSFQIQFCWVFCGNVFQSVNLDTIDWLHTLNSIQRCLRYLRSQKIIRHYYILVQHFIAVIKTKHGFGNLFQSLSTKHAQMVETCPLKFDLTI